MWAKHQFLDEFYSEAEKNRPKTFNKDWQKRLVNQFEQALGTFEASPSFDAEILDEVREEGYHRLSISVTTLPTLRMQFYLLFPDTPFRQPTPVVLALHGHGYGNRDPVGLTPLGTKRKGPPTYHKDFAVSFVKKGLAVAVPELIGFGNRRYYAPGYESENENDNSCYSLASQLLLFRKTLAGLRVFEVRRLIDYLQTMKEVDRKAIGCMGFSGGGLVAAFTAILDERIRATVISGYTNDFRHSIMARRHCLDNYIPGIFAYAEMPELIALIAPRPLFIEAGSEDHLFPIQYTKNATEVIESIYAQLGAKNAVFSHYFDGGHEICGERSINWLYDQLLLGP